MLKFRILIIVLLIASQNIYSQVDIRVLVKQSLTKQAKLYLYHQSGSVLVDSSLQKSQGLFNFSLPKSYTQGLYKFTIGKNISFDFIIASEPQIIIETVVFAAEDSLKSIVSNENKVFFQYQKIKKSLNQQVWFLNSLVDYYPDSSKFRKQLSDEIYKAQITLNDSSLNLAIKNPNLFASNLILLEIRPIPDANLSSNEKKSFQMLNWWKDANLNDIRFINSRSLESKLWGFIDLYFNDVYDKEQQDSSFVAAVKTVMNLNAEQSIKSFIRNILLKNYLETDYDGVTKFLYQTRFDDLPPITLSPEEKNSYEIQSKNGVGTKASDFSFTDANSKKLKLPKINTPYKLIVFWSMWCPHCTEMIPELYQIYLDYKLKGFEVVAVCIDDELEGWKKYVDDKNQSWINTIESDNGKNRILSAYNVDGTPKLFLVDKDLTIISRPLNVKQLEAKLKEIFKSK